MRPSPGTPARALLAVLTSAAVFASGVFVQGAPLADRAPLLGATVAYAAVTTPQIKAKQAEADAARKRMEDLNAEFEMKVEDYLAATEALEKTRGDIEVTRKQLEDATRRLGEAQDRLGERALGIYIGGEIDIFSVLVGVTSFDDLITRIDMLNRISLSDAELVAQVTGEKATIEQAEVTLENRQAQQVALRQQAEAKRLAVEASLTKQKQFVASLDAEVTKLVKAEEERQRKIREELARQAALAATARRAQTRTSDTKLGSPHPEVVDVAMKYIGIPYVWGGTSPSGFDCSGLTQYSYRQIGIALPRTSREQYRVGAFIAVADMGRLEAGDLVFFGYDGDPDRVHHVGIYVGNGNYLHAPGTGDYVCVSSLTARISSRGDYVGAVRP